MDEFGHQDVLLTQADTYRRVNEGIHRGRHEATEPFLCECVQDECNGLVELRDEEYEAVRAYPWRFFVQIGHELPEMDAVVERHDRYLVVERAIQSDEPQP